MKIEIFIINNRNKNSTFTVCLFLNSTKLYLEEPRRTLNLMDFYLNSTKCYIFTFLLENYPIPRTEINYSPLNHYMPAVHSLEPPNDDSKLYSSPATTKEPLHTIHALARIFLNTRPAKPANESRFSVRLA